MIIRPAQPADFDRIRELHEERLVIIHRPVDSDRMLYDRLYTRDAIVFVGDDGDEIRGFVIGRICDGWGVIDEIALDAHHYTGGLGRMMVRQLRERFQQHTIERMVVRAPRYYAVEQAFWRALGAEEWKETTWETAPEDMWMIL